MSDTKGNHVSITTFVDAYHAHYLEYRWSVTRVIVFINKTPIQWNSTWKNDVKNQPTSQSCCP